MENEIIDKVVDLGLTQYDLQKAQYKNISPLDPLIVIADIKEISEKILNSNSHYFMLLNNERKDYTLINNTLHCSDNLKFDNLKFNLQEAIQNRGEILDIYDGIEKNSWNIWIRDNNEIYMYILFDYNNGVIEI